MGETERERPREGRRSRRGFLGALGSGIVATAGLAGTASAGTPPTVAMGTNYFDPVGLAVDPGTTVRFEVESGSHSATAYEDRIPAAATPFDSGTLSEGAFEHAFETPGTYDYHCVPHESMGMTGRIVVGEPGGPAEATPIPEGDVPDGDEIRERGRVGADEADGSRLGHERPMDPQPVATGGGRRSWRMLAPAGVVTTLLGLAGGVGYAAGRRREAAAGRGDDPAVAELEERRARPSTTRRSSGVSNG